MSRTPLSGSRAENALQGAPGGFQATPGRAAGTLPPMRPIKGTPVAPGLAHGALHVVRARADVVPTWTIRGDEVASERARVEEAVTEAAATLQRRQETVRETVGQQDAGIFAVHRMILEDPSALQRVQRIIDEQRINAEAAVHELIDHLNATMGSLEGDSVRGYGADVSDPWRMVLDLLLRREQASFVAAGESVVLAAAELTPQVVTCLKRERILAVITEAGGRFSHGAVLARSFGIPCVVGLSNLLGRLEQGMTVLVDGDSGSIQLSPSEEEVETFTRRQQRRATRREALFASAHESACTPDGRRLSVCVNLESLYDLETFDVEHCDGVGLLRSEFLYLDRSQFPSEEEQFRLYRRVVEHMGERRVVLRTLDIGGDKALPYFKTPAENNPQLGWRGLRILLEWQDLLRVQLRAALRASAYGSIALLLPMVSSLEEVLAVRKIIRGVRKSLAELHRFEDLIQPATAAALPGRVADGTVGLWHSDAFDVWGAPPRRHSREALKPKRPRPKQPPPMPPRAQASGRLRTRTASTTIRGARRSVRSPGCRTRPIRSSCSRWPSTSTSLRWLTA